MINRNFRYYSQIEFAMHRLIFIAVGICLGYLSFSQPQDSTLFSKGIAFARSNQYDQALAPLLYTVSDSSSVSLFSKGKAHYYLKKVFWAADDFSTAFSHGDKAIEIFVRLKNHEWLGETYFSLCMNNLIAGFYDIALLQAQKAYDEFYAINDTSMMIWSMARRGIVFHDIGEYDEGIRVCNQAQNLFNSYSENDANIQAMIWGITAINYDDMGRSDKAVEFYRKILPLAPHLSSDREITRTHNNMGNSLMKLGLLDEAEEHFLINLQKNERDNFRYGIATVKTNLGTIAYKRGDFSQANLLLNEAEKISYEINDAEKILDVLQQKHLMFEIANEPTQSLHYLKEYYAVKDSLYDLDKQRQIQFLETRFETEKKEQQIALQNAEIDEQKAVIQRNQILLLASVIAIILIVSIALLQRSRLRKKQLLKLQEAQIEAREAEINATISSQEKERSRYARDLHDGFGQMISILNMNLKQLKDRAKPNERQKVFEESAKVIDEMYGELKNICFDLMPQTLIKNGLESALKEFVERVNQVGNLSIELHMFGLDQRLTELQEISLYRISQEWINNILKYSDATKVTLQITKDEDEITLLIEDDGAGFDRSLLTSGEGNGWKNLNTRANLIKGELELETHPETKGNSLIINVPVQVQFQKEVEQNTVEAV